MDNKLYDKVITKLQDKDTPKIELKDYGFYKNAAVTFIKDSKVYYAVLNNGSNGSENSILNPMKEVVSIMELLKQEHDWHTRWCLYLSICNILKINF